MQAVGDREAGEGGAWRTIASAESLVAALMATSIGVAVPVSANTEVETAELLIKLVQVGRGVLSENQAIINDASKGDKGFTGDFVANQVIERFRKATKIDLSRPATSAAGALIPCLGGIREGSDR